jgi:hypothetical membrane protein
MQSSFARTAGTLLFIGAVQFILALTIAEALYPGYSISDNYISDLGVGPSATIFNASVFLLGLLMIIGAYLIQRALNTRLLAIFLLLTGIGAMGVGIFTEDAGAIHAIVSLITFLFGGLSALASYRLIKPPLSYLAIIMGLIGLASLVLFISGTDLGLGVGGMERMIAYPLLLWQVGFGGHLVNQSQGTSTTAKQ